MARYRIGNDMTIIWSVTNKDGSSFPLAGKEVHLYYTCERGRFEADIQIQDNVVAWGFAGRDQRVLGGYTLTLEVIQPGGKRIIRKDICNAFTLVGKGCEENDTPGDADINEGGEITLVSELDVYKIQPIIPTVGSNSNWFVDGTDTGKPSTGKSAYEYAKEKGYEGTESEYAESLKLAPENAEKLTELSEEINGGAIYITDFSGYEKVELQIVNGNWFAAGNETTIVPIPSGKKVVIVANDNRDWFFSLLKSNNAASGVKADLCVHPEIENVTLPASGDRYVCLNKITVTFTTPSDCHYLAITTRLSGIDTTPKSIEVEGNEGVLPTIERIAKKVDEHETQIDQVQKEIVGTMVQVTDFSSYEKYNLEIASNFWIAHTSQTILFPVIGGEEYEIVGTSATYWYLSLLRNADNMVSGSRANTCTLEPIEGAKLAASGDRYEVPENVTLKFTTPQDCTYMLVMVSRAGIDTTPKEITKVGIRGMRQDISDLEKLCAEIEAELDNKIGQESLAALSEFEKEKLTLLGGDIAVKTTEGAAYVSQNLDKPIPKGAIIYSFNGYKGAVSFVSVKDGVPTLISGASNLTEAMLPKFLPADANNISMSVGGDMKVTILPHADYPLCDEVVYEDDLSNIVGIAKIANSQKVYSHYAATDFHGNSRCIQVLKVLRKQDPNTPIFSMGDFVGGNPKINNELNAEVREYVAQAKELGIYHCVGQHECGFSSAGYTGATNKAEMLTHEEVFNEFFAPMRDVWDLPNLDKCYYFKDFAASKLRLIVLYQCNSPLVDDPSDPTRILYERSNIWYGTEQLSWLIETLSSTPQGYHVILMQHTPPESVVYDAYQSGFYSFGATDSANAITDGTPISDILLAYINRSAISKTYTAKDTAKYPTSLFSQKAEGDFGQAKGEFDFILFGDTHTDCYGKTVTTEIPSIGVTSSSSPQDCLLGKGKTDTIITCHALWTYQKKKALVVGRLGQTTSIIGDDRRIARINLQDL